MGSLGKGGGGKGGSGKGLVGEGGGGKGKGKGKGGGGSSSQVRLCFDSQILDEITTAFKGATRSTALSDGCTPGLMVVTLDVTTAQDLLAAVAQGLHVSICPDKKGKGKGKGKGKSGLKLVGKTKLAGKGRKAG